MLKSLRGYCADIHSEYCPCMLAHTNHCVFCSKLHGENYCDCNWSGQCIVYEKFWQDKTVKNGVNIVERKDFYTSIYKGEQVSETTRLFVIEVDEKLAEHLSKIGSFVFLRRAEDSMYYHFPVGVMKVEKKYITVIIENAGPKTQRFFEADINEIIVRGPYYNGIFGSPWIDNIIDGKILLVAGGSGQAPAVPIVKKLVTNRNCITAVLSGGKIGKIFILPELLHQNIKVHKINSLPEDGFSFLRKALQDNFDLLVSAGPDRQHTALIQFLHEEGKNIPMAATNNATMCCGEGICGSCHKVTANGKIIKLCKTQDTFMNLQEE